MAKKKADIPALVFSLNAAKHRRDNANDEIKDLESQIVAALGFNKTEGQSTFVTKSPSGEARLTLKQPITTSVDAEKWEAVRGSLPKAVRAGLMRTKYELETKFARALQTDDRDTWSKASVAITRKPGKVSVEVKSFGASDSPVVTIGSDVESEVTLDGDSES